MQLAVLLIICTPATSIRSTHRRRIKTEEKAKVVAAAWGRIDFIPCQAIAIFNYDDLRNRMKSSSRKGGVLLYLSFFYASYPTCDYSGQTLCMGRISSCLRLQLKGSIWTETGCLHYFAFALFANSHFKRFFLLPFIFSLSEQKRKVSPPKNYFKKFI